MDKQDPDDLLDLIVTPKKTQPATGEKPANRSTHEPTLEENASPALLNSNGRQPASAGGALPTAALPSDEIDPPSDLAADDVLAGEEEENWGALFLRELIETLVLSIVIFLVIRTGVQNYRIEGNSMEPNFHDGEYLLVNKLAYRLGEYSRGDVIVFKYPNDPSRDFIKRVIGLPGDTVEIHDGIIFINGIAMNEPYDLVPINYVQPPIVVEPDHLYVLGDNRPFSQDSHRWGLLPQDLVIGKAWVTVWPYTQWGVVTHPEIILDPKMAQGP